LSIDHLIINGKRCKMCRRRLNFNLLLTLRAPFDCSIKMFAPSSDI
jgi:hypothetical protein